jgi:Phospholipase_D-nuclease N-terminal
VVFATWQVGQLLWSLMWFTLFGLWIFVVISVFMDIFRSPDLGGWAKALWTVLVLFMPWLGVFIYLVVRGGNMADRRYESAYGLETPTGQYVGPTGTAGGDIGTLTSLRDRGVIDDAQLEAMKHRVITP